MFSSLESASAEKQLNSLMTHVDVKQKKMNNLRIVPIETIKKDN